MTSYFNIDYVNTRAPGEATDYPDDVKIIRAWSWARSALVRWAFVEPAAVNGDRPTPSLVIFDWSSKNAADAETIYQRLRAASQQLPIILLESYEGQTPTRDACVAADQRVRIIKDPTDTAQIAAGLDALNVALPAVSLKLHPDHNDLATKRLMEWVGQEHLPLMIQKYFPQASNAYILPVGGGWSDAKLCRLFVDTDENEFFLKFFTRRDDYIHELARHASAKKWLGAATVELKLVPDMCADAQTQNESFPDCGQPRFPVCYESASTREHRRETYKETYLDHTDEFIRGVLDRLLAILATDQPRLEVVAPPWSDSVPGAFRLTSDIKASVLDTLYDLAAYGPPMSGAAGWQEISKSIQALIYMPLPQWLYEPWPVALGHTHGDPNPRNCLVNPADKNDIQLIDCGDYKPDGRLVADLALIERDVKLVLMNTERRLDAFGDLDPTQLPGWCQAERDAISRRLDYAPAYAPNTSAPVQRAYQLIGRIRERAKQVSGPRDDHGRHYFAALLYWTLDVLKYQAVRPTKKLLAVYSAAEIIRLFAK